MEDEAEQKILELPKEFQKTYKKYTIEFKLKVVELWNKIYLISKFQRGLESIEKF